MLQKQFALLQPLNCRNYSSTIAPLSSSNEYGVDMYEKTLKFVASKCRIDITAWIQYTHACYSNTCIHKVYFCSLWSWCAHHSVYLYNFVTFKNVANRIIYRSCLVRLPLWYMNADTTGIIMGVEYTEKKKQQQPNMAHHKQYYLQRASWDI